jgi:hypothetical protein
MTRHEIHQEAEDDLRKDMIQLLTDAHEELLNPERPREINLLHGFKRFASLQARAAEAAEKQTKAVIRLTWVLVVLTLVLILIEVHREGLISWWPVVHGG